MRKIFIILFFSSFYFWGYSQTRNSNILSFLTTENRCINHLFIAVSDIENNFCSSKCNHFYVTSWIEDSTKDDRIITISQPYIGLIFQYPLYGVFVVNNSMFFIDSSASFLFQENGIKLVYPKTMINYEFANNFTIDDSSEWTFLLKKNQLSLVELWSIGFSEKDWFNYSTQISCFVSSTDSTKIENIDIIEEPVDPLPTIK